MCEVLMHAMWQVLEAVGEFFFSRFPGLLALAYCALDRSPALHAEAGLARFFQDEADEDQAGTLRQRGQGQGQGQEHGKRHQKQHPQPPSQQQSRPQLQQGQRQEHPQPEHQPPTEQDPGSWKRTNPQVVGNIASPAQQASVGWLDIRMY
jgi:hypothetical protein